MGTSASKPKRDEVIVMQQHSTGDNLVIYRGFLAKGGRHTVAVKNSHPSLFSNFYREAYTLGPIQVVFLKAHEILYRLPVAS